MILLIIIILFSFIFLLVPAIIVRNRKLLAEMEKEISKYQRLVVYEKNPAQALHARQITMKHLIDIKSQITVVKQDIEKARDLIASI